jgi:hypothetical protein
MGGNFIDLINGYKEKEIHQEKKTERVCIDPENEQN